MAPDTRMQRTRSSDSARRTPGMGCPSSGDRRSASALLALLVLAHSAAGCRSAASATPPSDFISKVNCWGHMLPWAEHVAARRFAGVVVLAHDQHSTLKGVTVFVRPLNHDSVKDVRSVTSDEEGRFAIAGLPDGKYDAVACYSSAGFNPWIGVVTISRSAVQETLVCSLELGT